MLPAFWVGSSGPDFVVEVIPFAPATADVIYVDDDAGVGGNGQTWGTAYKYLQDALADANSNGDVNEIRVAAGVYRPDDDDANHPDGSGLRTATFQIINGVALKGGYAGFGEPDPNARDVKLYETILSGDLNGDDVGFTNNDENSYRVVTASNGVDETAVLDGVTITAGNANNPLEIGPKEGGGVYCDYSNPTITNCTFAANFAEYGGGMYNGYGTPTVTNCTFSGNSSGYNGGGMCNWGGSPTLTNCVFIGNSASSWGGGLYSDLYGNPNLNKCRFIGNTAEYGGGICHTGGGATLTNCIFSSNSASNGGGMANYYYSGSQMLINCTFSANSALNGKALSCDSDDQQYPSTIQLVNCILWDGDGEIWNNDGSTIAVTYSDVQGGWSGPGGNNIDADPCFADPCNADYHLKSQAGRWDPNSQTWLQDDVTSPCIDAGDMASPIGYEPFPNGGIINMGAYGGTAEASKSYFGEPLCETIVAGDINGDCRVDFADFALMAFHWLEDNRPVNSNSIVKDNIEYYIQTDKSIYNLGENVEMLFRVTNLGVEDVTIGCYQSPEFNLWVQENGETIWALHHGFYLFSPGVELSPGESVELPYVWDMKDDDDNPVGPGIYDVVGVMYNEWNTEVAVPITVVPEPG